MIGMCGRCYDENIEIFPANCLEHPEDLKELFFGMYHCPDCGAMLLAGMNHPYMCGPCMLRQKEGFDVA